MSPPTRTSQTKRFTTERCVRGSGCTCELLRVTATLERPSSRDAYRGGAGAGPQLTCMDLAWLRAADVIGVFA